MDSKQFVHCFLQQEVSPAALAAARTALLDYLAASLQARGASELAQVQTAYADQLNGDALVLGNGQGTAAFAALYNGFQAHLLDLDDAHAQVRGHPSAVLFSVLLTELPHVSGREFLAAYVIGVEIMARLGAAVNPGHYLHGWHNTSTLGGIAAAGALAYLKNFSVEQTLNALSIAASQAAGLQMQFGTPVKPLHAGLAAKQAVEAVQLASAGFQAEKDFLFAKRGFFSVYATQVQAEKLFTDWGSSWQVVTPGLWFKQYSFCSAAMAGADAARALFEKYRLTDTEIAQVTVGFFPGKDQALINRKPETGEEGRFSIEYIVWLGVTGQSYGLAAFTPAKLAPALQRQLRKVHREYLPAIGVPYTQVTVTLTDGREFSERITHAKGTPENPLTPAEQRQKFDRSLHGSLAEEIAATVLQFDQKQGMELFKHLKKITTDGGNL